MREESEGQAKAAVAKPGKGQVKVSLEEAVVSIKACTHRLLTPGMKKGVTNFVLREGHSQMRAGVWPSTIGETRMLD